MRIITVQRGFLTKEEVGPMKKQELVSRVATRAGLRKKDVEAVLDAFVEVVKEALKRGESVRLVGFGTFKIQERKGRRGINPRTRETIQIQPRKVPVFRASPKFRDEF